MVILLMWPIIARVFRTSLGLKPIFITLASLINVENGINEKGGRIFVIKSKRNNVLPLNNHTKARQNSVTNLSSNHSNLMIG